MSLDIDEIENAGFDWEVTKRLGGYVVPYRKNIFLAMIAALMSVFAQVAGPPMVGYAVDEGIRKGNLSLVGFGVVGYLMIQAIGALGFRLQISLMAVAGQKAITRLRDDLFEHINRLSLAFFLTV